MIAPHALTAPTLHLPGLRHGFFTRQGGVCQGLQDGRANDLSAGFSPKADPASIEENRRRLRYALGYPFVTAQQVHGAGVLTVTAPWDARTHPREADGLVTNLRQQGLGILSADCGPLLLADVDAGVIGACHVGWKGLRAGIVAATVTAMVALGAQRRSIRSALGPCLGRVSYEVGLEFPDHFAGVLPQHRSFFRPGRARDRLLFDLPRAIVVSLQATDVRRPEVLSHDTFVEKDTFFSYRRALHNRQADYGRQISLIALE